VERAKSAPLVVRWRDDGSEEPQVSLEAAIQRATGKAAEIILRDGGPMILAPESPLIISSGRVVLRAEEGAHPVILVRWDGAQPALMVRLDGSLSCTGLTFKCEPARATSRTVLIECVGNLTLDSCTFGSVSPAAGLTAVVAGGGRTDVRRCVFRGIETGIRIEAFAGSSSQVSHCLFVGPMAGDAGGSAVSLIDRLSREQNSARKLLIDRCTVVGMGLLALDGLTTDHPVEVDVRGTVLVGPRVLNWTGPSAFPGGLKWTGSDNRYAIEGPSWAHGADGPLPGGPDDLDSWGRVVRGEAGSRSGAVRFRGGEDVAALRDLPVDGFALDGPDAQAIGFDPASSP
jgi:hypothetical protein